MSSFTNEEWRDIQGYEGKYMVSNYGRVKSTKAVHSVHGRLIQIERDKIMTLTDNGNGYLIVGLRGQDGKRKNMYIHRLVAEAFVPNESSGKIVNHKDFNKQNNNADNLEWCTQKENIIYSREHMSIAHNTPVPASGEKYIHFRKGRYRVFVRPLHFDRTFKTLEEAVSERNSLLEGTKWKV